MKLSTQAIVTAAGLLLVSAGALMPVRGDISELEQAVTQLESETLLDDSLDMQLDVVRQQLAELGEQQAAREFHLCPDTPESRNALEGALLAAMQKAGLVRVSMDRKPGAPIAQLPSFVIALVVEGGAYQLHDFLRAIERLDWVTRVLKLEVQQGDLRQQGDRRRIQMQLAVPLEKTS